MSGYFDNKPSDSHVVWQTERGKKKFDFEYLELWAAHFGVEYQEWERTDHARGDRQRHQHVCVFRWNEDGGEELSLGDRTWTMGENRRPRTFIEIDEAGMARFEGWTSEAILDLAELVLDGPTCRLHTTAGETKRLDVWKLARRPRHA